MNKEPKYIVTCSVPNCDRCKPVEKREKRTMKTKAQKAAQEVWKRPERKKKIRNHPWSKQSGAFKRYRDYGYSEESEEKQGWDRFDE